jgi:hypothetical protein
MSAIPTTKRRLMMLGLLCAFTLVMAMAASPAVAVSSYAGGADQVPTYIPNDHTPVAVHFTATGLATSAAYYVKVRFTHAAAPDSATNRGWTWNGALKRWTQERDDWANFPTVSTDSTGSIQGNLGWVFAKFGDETTSGPYHVMVSLSIDGLSNHTMNGTDDTMTTVIDSSHSFWIHNGAATAIQNAKRVEIDDSSVTPNVGPFTTLSKTETNTVDDDSNGIVDDEDWGPAGKRGDFRVAVPTGHELKVCLAGGSVTWAAFRSDAPGVDLALSAAETIAPSAPATLVATRGDDQVALSWPDSTDNVAVTGYGVFRSQEPTQIGGAANYTVLWTRIATVGVPGYTDITAVNGTRYLYKVRAMDAATNGSPFSEVAQAIPAADNTPPSPVTALSGLAGSSHVAIAWTDPSDPDLAGVLIARGDSSYPEAPDPGFTQPKGGVVASSTSSTVVACDDHPLVDGQTYFYSVFAFDTSLNYSTVATFEATPEALEPVSSLTAEAGDGEVSLTWSNPTTDYGSTLILRSSSGFAADPAAPGQTTVSSAASTSCADSTPTNGVTYFYTAFALDRFGGSSAPATATATPKNATSLALSRSPKIVDFRGTVVLTARLTSHSSPLTGVPGIAVWRRTDPGQPWTLDGTATFSPSAAAFVTSRRITSNTYFKVTFSGNGAYAGSESAAVLGYSRTALSTPGVRRVSGRRFLVTGTCSPKSTGKTTLLLQRLVRGVWRNLGRPRSVSVGWSPASYSKYSARISFSAAGSFRIRAYHTDGSHYPTYSHWRTFSVR